MHGGCFFIAVITYTHFVMFTSLVLPVHFYFCHFWELFLSASVLSEFGFSFLYHHIVLSVSFVNMLQPDLLVHYGHHFVSNHLFQCVLFSLLFHGKRVGWSMRICLHGSGGGKR